MAGLHRHALTVEFRRSKDGLRRWVCMSLQLHNAPFPGCLCSVLCWPPTPLIIHDSGLHILASRGAGVHTCRSHTGCVWLAAVSVCQFSYTVETTAAVICSRELSRGSRHCCCCCCCQAAVHCCAHTGPSDHRAL